MRRALLLSLTLLGVLGAAPSAPPVELGTVSWLRDFDRAQTISKKSAKPIFLLFQEVPG